MTQERYQKIYAWFTARPAALAALRWGCRVLPLFVAASYGVLLARQGARWYDTVRWPLLYTAAETAQRMAGLWRAVLVPAATLAGGTLLRAVLNKPRPYDAPGFVPLLEKETKGKAFPSRHALSAGVIAGVWLAVAPPMGVLLTVVAAALGAGRVLAGVHSPADVAAGLALGLACGLLGMLG